MQRFLSVDPLADKYPEMTPYQYGANNPILMIDVNGDSIKINDINYTAGMNTSKEYDEFTNYTIKALNYIYENGGKKKLNKLINSKEGKYLIFETKKLNDIHFEPIADVGGEISYNPQDAAEFEEGKVSSVVQLAHELEHAYKNEKLAFKERKTGNFEKLINFQVPSKKMREKEENRAVKGLERKIAKSLNQFVRKNYKVPTIRHYKSKGPFSIEEINN